MAAILRKAINVYVYLFEDLADQRILSWPLVGKPYQGLALLTLYLMFVLKWGPKWMKTRKPFNLKKIMIIYNALQVVTCSFLFVQAIIHGWGWKYKWVCEPSDFTETTQGYRVAKLTYLYLILKVADLMDTVFFVLRKKNGQISFLHVYHHTGMVALIWGATTYYPGGHGSLVGVINCFVHAVMYFYYLLTVAKPSFKGVIWIKKSITQLQILQFFLCVVHMTTIIFKPDCEYPRWVSAVFLPQNLFMLALFLDFYRKTYMKKPNRKVDLNENMVDTKNERLNDTNGYANNKFDLNSDVALTAKTGSGIKNYDHLNRVNGYKVKNNHCEKLIENSDTKYKKHD